MMARWGYIPPPEQEQIVVSGNKGEVNWFQTLPEWRKKKESCPVGQGTYANSSETKKLFRRTFRIRRSFRKKMFFIENRPLWMVSCGYPRERFDSLTASELKDDIATLRKKINRGYPAGWFSYFIEWSIKAHFHLHLLGRCGKSKPKARSTFKAWWADIVDSDKGRLVQVDKLRSWKDAHNCIKYMAANDKISNQVNVTKFLDGRKTFGFFNEKNIRFEPDTKLRMTPEEFDQLRPLIHDDLPIEFRKQGKLNWKDHEYQILYGKAVSHKCNDPRLFKRLKKELEVIRRKAKGGK